MENSKEETYCKIRHEHKQIRVIRPHMIIQQALPGPLRKVDVVYMTFNRTR